MKFTPEQIENWRRYEKVRQSGKWNMFDPRATVAARLTKEEKVFVMKNYSELESAARKQEAK